MAGGSIRRPIRTVEIHGMTKVLAALLLAGGLFLGACAEPVPPTGSPLASGPASGGPSSATAPAVPSGSSASPAGALPSVTPMPPAATARSTAPAVTPTGTSSAPPPLSEYPQSWTGTWEDPVTGGSGSLELTMIGRGSGFGGSITMDGTACLSNGILSGTYDGRDIEFSVGQRDVEIHFTGAGDESTMAGTFVTDCDAMNGTWHVSRSGR